MILLSKATLYHLPNILFNVIDLSLILKRLKTEKCVQRYLHNPYRKWRPFKHVSIKLPFTHKNVSTKWVKMWVMLVSFEQVSVDKINSYIFKWLKLYLSATDQRNFELLLGIVMNYHREISVGQTIRQPVMIGNSYLPNWWRRESSTAGRLFELSVKTQTC